MTKDIIDLFDENEKDFFHYSIKEDKERDPNLTYEKLHRYQEETRTRILDKIKKKNKPKNNDEDL